jgi:hypothetical protein
VKDLRYARVSAYVFWIGLTVILLARKMASPIAVDTWWFGGINYTLVVIPAMSWLLYDSRARNVKNGHIYVAASAALAGIIIPIYLIKTRGWRLSGLWLLRFSGYLFLTLLGYAVVVVTLQRMGLLNA